MTNLGLAMGYEAEIGWMQVIMSWSVQWSALHGIAKAKTPVLKMITRADATASKYTLDWEGAGQPESAVQGSEFSPPAAAATEDLRLARFSARTGEHRQRQR